MTFEYTTGSPLIAQVTPFEVDGKKGNWFKISACPKWLGGDIKDFIKKKKVVSDAHLMGMHNAKDVMRYDPRFTSEQDAKEPEFAVVQMSETSYLAVMNIMLAEWPWLEALIHSTYKDHRIYKDGDAWTAHQGRGEDAR